MVYHFKKKIDAIEKKNETLQDICKTICEELDFVKSHKPQNIDPFYLNYHTVNKQSEYIPNVSELFKTILVSSGNTTNPPDALEIQNYENEELDDVHSYDGEDFEYHEESDNTTTSSVQEVEDFLEENPGFFQEVMLHVQKMDPFVRPTLDVDSRVEEIHDEEIEDQIEEQIEEDQEIKVEEIKVEEQIKEDQEIKVEEIKVEEIKVEEIKEDQEIEVDNQEAKEEEEQIPKDEEIVQSEDTQNKLGNEETPLEDADTKATKAALQKLTLQMLRTMVIKDGLCTDPSKLKKVELIQIVLDSHQ
jgi:hypothetical protein